MKLNEMIKKLNDALEFCVHEEKARGCGESSILHYNSYVSRFIKFYSEDHAGDEEVGEPTYLDIQKFRDHLESTGIAPTTMNLYLTILSSFFNIVSDETLGEIRFFERNPVSHRLFPSMKSELAKPYDQILTDEQVAKLWENTPVRGHGIKARNWPRNYAIVMLFLATEIRNKELLDLKVSDLDFEYGEIQIWEGKGRKYRCIDFPEIAQTAVKLYLNSGLRPEGLSDDDYLFGSTSENSFGTNSRDAEWHRGSREWMSNLVCRHVKLVTGVGNVRSHDLRHVGARLDLHNGMRAEELQAKLGHASVTTTQIYSGKLGSNRKRQTAKRVYEERDYQTARNKMMLDAI